MIPDPFNFLCSDAECGDIENISQAFKHKIKTGHDVYQFVMVDGEAQLVAMIDDDTVKDSTAPQPDIKRESGSQSFVIIGPLPETRKRGKQQ